MSLNHSRLLKPSSVHVINKKLDIKVSDYTIIRRINNLRELVVNEGENISTGSSKSDIYQLVSIPYIRPTSLCYIISL